MTWLPVIDMIDDRFDLDMRSIDIDEFRGLLARYRSTESPDRYRSIKRSSKIDLYDRFRSLSGAEELMLYSWGSRRKTSGSIFPSPSTPFVIMLRCYPVLGTDRLESSICRVLLGTTVYSVSQHHLPLRTQLWVIGPKAERQCGSRGLEAETMWRPRPTTRDETTGQVHGLSAPKRDSPRPLHGPRTISIMP